uniref:Uncharacterized protein n=1 Tax=Ascaris lumbricoides TaxID=6252 RepID=A0A0M3IVR9_ASCLU
METFILFNCCSLVFSVPYINIEQISFQSLFQISPSFAHLSKNIPLNEPLQKGIKAIF